MYHVLIITDNRILMRQLYEMLEDSKLYKVYVISFSVDAFDVFYRHRIDLVILDSGVYMSYRSILESFEQCQWQYNVLLLTEENEEVQESSEIIVLNKNDLSIEVLNKSLEVAQTKHNEIKDDYKIISIDWNGEVDFVYHADAYNLFLIKKTRENYFSKEDAEYLRSEMRNFGEFNIITTNNQEILFSISRSDMSSDYRTDLLIKKIFEKSGNDQAVFYLENIIWKKLEEACSELKTLSCNNYFLEGNAINAGKMNRNNIEVSLHYLDQNIKMLISSVMSGDSAIAEQVLQELYLHVIKQYYDWNAREYIRMNIDIINFLFSGQTEASDIFKFNFGSVE